MAFIGIIPSRYASTRFPGKPLALIGDKPMIQWVYERCRHAGLERVVVATDDHRIVEVVAGFGGEYIMTSPTLPSGTDRCGEAARLLHLNDEDVVINIQGDEPFIHAEEIQLLIDKFKDQDVEIATLAYPIDATLADLPNIVKVIFTNNYKALYFSRSKIPYPRENTLFSYHKHVGIYAYKNSVLQQIIALPESSLEKTEKLEQLRWLENGYAIYLSVCDHETIAVDTPEDLVKANQFLKQQTNP